MMIDRLVPTILPAPGQRQHWGRIVGNSNALLITELAKQHPMLVITADNAAVAEVCQALPCFTEQTLPVLPFPDYETLPYDQFSPHQTILSDRLQTLAQLPYLQRGIVVIAISSLMQRVAPVNYLNAHTFAFTCGDKLDIAALRERLNNIGYHCVSQVMQPGEFAIRGAIIDLFPMGSHTPYRLDLFDDEIDSIRQFDPDNQLSTGKINNIALLPAKEFPTNADGISQFRQQWQTLFAGNPSQCPMYQHVSDGIFPQGVEYYLPLFFNETASLFDYLPNNTLCIAIDNIADASQHFWQEIQQRHEQYRHDITRPLLTPDALFLSTDKINQYYKQFSYLSLHPDQPPYTKHTVMLDIEPCPTLTINHRLKQPLSMLQDYLTQLTNTRVLLCAESAGRREIMLTVLRNADIHPTNVTNWEAFLTDNTITLGITIAVLTTGFHLTTANIVVITEAQLMGEHINQRVSTQRKAADPDSIIRNLTELHIGDPVVHIDNGVGRYLGLQHLTIDSIANEFLVIGYANDDKLYVPVSSLNLISRYSGVDSEHAPLYKLGSEQWARVKRKAAEKIRDVAAELLNIYAKRQTKSGIVFNKTDANYSLFANGFPFTETLDQQQAIAATIDDMCSSKMMDRLICGDVGFGKTEVAMRAAFIAVQSTKQVAILVPTTLLAQQHYQTFCDRFADWPIRIETLSRFKSAKQQTIILTELASGKIDIIIGTHKLIQPQIKFHALGLVIIDEEHRFGVRQKEQFKTLRAEVDLLTLTATPIPRTLNMAMSQVRDLSIIATPPAKRLSIKTFVRQTNNALISEAIQREILRGGQVYFIHNNVQTIQRCADNLQALIPEARIAIAHGQLRERDLEKTMSEFYHHHYNILVCTTIIETGIDVPTANTIIIDKADHFGLAQLHQLRGRVGRSHHQAYAYLLTRGEKASTKDAEKRLTAIASLEELGAGFMLATHDLEIRGAGELLGDEQSGQIQSIGFTLYTELLEKAVHALQQGELLEVDQVTQANCDINLRIPALIPDDYLPDVHTRLILYKRIANASSSADLDELQIEMIDRFGLLPTPTKHLFAIAALKLHAIGLKVTKIDANTTQATLEFTQTPNIDPDTIIKLIQTEPDRYQLIKRQQLRIQFDKQHSDTIEQRIASLSALLDKIR